MSAAAVAPGSVRSALRTVIDPEIGRDIVSLGMVYGIEVDDTTVVVTLTLTSPGCPLGRVILQAVEASVHAVPGVEHVRTHLAWEPPWHPDMIEDRGPER